MISRDQLTRRLGITQRALTHTLEHRPPGPTTRRLQAALDDVAEVTKGATISRAIAHLTDHQAGYPATSTPSPGAKNAVTNRTLDTAVPDHDHQRDKVSRDVDELEQLTTRLQANALDTCRRPDIYQLAKQLEEDARVTRSILKAWAREPDIRWCKHCIATNGHKEPVPPGGRYRDVCRRCGDWRRTNKALPPKAILPYLQTRKPVPQRLLAQNRMKTPRPRGRVR